MSLAAKLVKLRKEKNFTQQQLADAVGIHVNSLKKYESEQALPSLEVLKKLSKFWHVSTDYLLFDEHERGPNKDLTMQLEAINQFDEEDKTLVLGVLEGLILKHQAKQSMQRQLTQRTARQDKVSNSALIVETSF